MDADTYFLLDSSALKWSLLFGCERGFDVHPINKGKAHKGEFANLYYELRKHPNQFFEYMRMSISTFDMILSKISNRIQKKITRFNTRPITPAERLMITIRHLSTGMSFRQLRFCFRRGKTTINYIVHQVCSAIWELLSEEYMPVPKEDNLRKIATDYYNRWGFPNCIGSLDGRHCQIKNVKHGGSTHFNYMKYFSIVLQGVADANKKFITIDVGARGKQHDSTTFSNSKLHRLLEKKKFNVPPDAAFPNSSVTAPFVMIADEAYPLKTYLMRPYPKKQLTARHEKFNDILSAARKCIECAFGILRAKWRFMSKEIEVYPAFARLLIRTACLLHNIVRERDGDTDIHYLNTLSKVYGSGQTSENRGNFSRTQRNRSNNNGGTAAKNVREKFTDYFQNS